MSIKNRKVLQMETFGREFIFFTKLEFFWSELNVHFPGNKI